MKTKTFIKSPRNVVHYNRIAKKTCLKLIGNDSHVHCLHIMNNIFFVISDEAKKFETQHSSFDTFQEKEKLIAYPLT